MAGVTKIQPGFSQMKPAMHYTITAGPGRFITPPHHPHALFHMHLGPQGKG